jgi:hypothetical protein
MHPLYSSRAFHWYQVHSKSCWVLGDLNTTNKQTNKQTRGVSHCGLAIHIKKYLNAKDDIWKLKYFIMQNYNLQKNPLKRNQNPSRHHNSITNLKFQDARCAKISIFQKSSYKK